jgi:hypothetical protein
LFFVDKHCGGLHLAELKKTHNIMHTKGIRFSSNHRSI